MKRRGFIGSLCGFLVAPKILPEISLPEISLPVKSSGIIYAPYIPIVKYRCIEDMLCAKMCKEIQEEIDNEVINKMMISAKQMGY